MEIKKKQDALVILDIWIDNELEKIELSENAIFDILKTGKYERGNIAKLLNMIDKCHRRIRSYRLEKIRIKKELRGT